MLKENAIALISEEIPEELKFIPVFSQSKLIKTREGKLNPESLIKWALYCLKRDDKEEFNRIFNNLMTEYKPLLQWAYSCWDYVLTTEGFRYLPRKGIQKYYCHGDYRAFTLRDFKRLIHKSFKELLLSYSLNGSITRFLKKHIWGKIISNYNLLKIPQNKKERTLTNYSYLRCIPYKFFNRYHQEKVENTILKLKPEEIEIIELYFFKFYKDKVCAQEKNMVLEEFLSLKEKILAKINQIDNLSYALLKQIERY
jgi:hypothetical protein